VNDTNPKPFTTTLTDFGAEKKKQAEPLRPPASAKPSTDQANDAEPNTSVPQKAASADASPCGPVYDPVSGDTESFVEKRAEQRVMVKAPAVLQLESGTIDCTTFDLSSGGVKLKLSHDLFKNVRINIANFGEISGQIIWRDDDYVGVEFDEDQTEIVRALTRVAY